jgi:hypothetical protein
MPIGNSELDYELAQKAPAKTFLFHPDDGLFHMVYAGTMWPKARAVLERFLQALTVLRDTEPQIMSQLRIHFVGTGKSPNEPEGQIRPYLNRFGLEPWVTEHPRRIGYLDVLQHLAQSSAILIFGSTEAHYTPSKIFQSVQAKRPIFALLHKQSTAVSILNESRAGTAVTFSEDALPHSTELATILATFIRDPQYCAGKVRWDLFDAYSARNSARLLAAAVDRALELFKTRRLPGCES